MENLRLIAGAIILGTWFLFLIASGLSHGDVVVDPGLTAAALAVVTFLFGLSVVDRIKKNGKNGNHDAAP